MQFFSRSLPDFPHSGVPTSPPCPQIDNHPLNEPSFALASGPSQPPFLPFDLDFRPFAATLWRPMPFTLKLYEFKDLLAVPLREW
jgi:hypothetical protein